MKTVRRVFCSISRNIIRCHWRPGIRPWLLTDDYFLFFYPDFGTFRTYARASPRLPHTSMAHRRDTKGVVSSRVGILHSAGVCVCAHAWRKSIRSKNKLWYTINNHNKKTRIYASCPCKRWLRSFLRTGKTSIKSYHKKTFCRPCRPPGERNTIIRPFRGCAHTHTHTAW